MRSLPTNIRPRRVWPSLRLAFFAACALATSCSSAFAQDHDTWRCDAPNRSYSVNAPPIWDKTTSISGRINFHKGDFGPDFSSMAKIAFKDSKLKDGDCHCNGLFVEGFQDPDRVGFYMLVDGEPVLLDTGRKLDTPITFKFSIDPQGVMTLQVGKEHVDIKTAILPHPERDTMMMSCSGADVSFLNVNPQ